MSITCAILTQNVEVWRLMRCVEATKNQAYPPDEIMLVDYGSSQEYIKAYKEIVPKIVAVQPKGLFHPARMCNIAARQTSCQKIVFTGADELPGYKNYKLAHAFIGLSFVTCNRINLPPESDSKFEKFPFEKWRTLGTVTKTAYGSFLGFDTEWIRKNPFDERIIGWGAYDKDIVARAKKELTHVNLSDYGGELMHIWHPRRQYFSETDIQKNEIYYREKL